MGLFRKKVEEPKIEMPMATYWKWNKTVNELVKELQSLQKKCGIRYLTDVKPDLTIIHYSNPEVCRWPEKAPFDECGDKPVQGVEDEQF